MKVMFSEGEVTEEYSSDSKALGSGQAAEHILGGGRKVPHDCVL